MGGGLESAGGIGGLLARSSGYSGVSGSWSTHYYYHCDGNGNVTCLISGSQVVTAAHRYDPFGNTFASSGGLASANVYRFSSKMIDRNAGTYYYGYRHYDPNLQRWLSRDPIGEVGGINLYGFVGNAAPNSVDPLGLIYDDPLFDGFHPTVRKCSWDKTCQQNLLALFQYTTAAENRRRNDFTKAWRMTGTQQGWDEHRIQFLNILAVAKD